MLVWELSNKSREVPKCKMEEKFELYVQNIHENQEEI